MVNKQRRNLDWFDGVAVGSIATGLMSWAGIHLSVWLFVMGVLCLVRWWIVTRKETWL